MTQVTASARLKIAGALFDTEGGGQPRIEVDRSALVHICAVLDRVDNLTAEVRVLCSVLTDVITGSADVDHVCPTRAKTLERMIAALESAATVQGGG